MYPQYPLASSKLDFYKTEIIIIAINLILALLYTRTEDAIVAILIPLFLMIITFCIDHAYCVIFDKQANALTILKKALFVNKYKISKRYELNNFVGARVDRIRAGRYGYAYIVNMHKKDGEIIQLLPVQSSNSKHWHNMQQKIDYFYKNNQNFLKINECPMTFRLVSIPAMIIPYYMMFEAIFR